MVIKYYQKHTEKIRKAARERYKNLSEEEKDKRQKKRYQNFTEEEKEKRPQYFQERQKKLPDCRRNYYLAHKK